MTDLSHTALILVDSQIGVVSTTSTFYGTTRSNPLYETSITTLLSVFRSLQGPNAPKIIHIYHSSIHPTSPLHHSKPSMGFHSSSLPLPSEPVFSKTTNSAFITPELGEYIKEKEIWTIYFVGLSVDLCLGSTIRHASDLKIGEHANAEGEIVPGKIYLVEDATSAWAKKNGKFDAETTHGVSVESLCPEFCEVVRMEEVLRRIGFQAPVPPTLRIARPTNNLEVLTKFYTEGLGLQELGSFKDHNSFDGVMLGHLDYQWHLEFTHQHGVTVKRAPSKEHLLVFYEPKREKWEGMVERVGKMGGVRVESENPWWEVNGATFEDPDGYRIVLYNGSWPTRRTPSGV
jgi:nicotinamidase-related amidase/catechol 2,3-dioxygenase-like lactoylglutathione lyase family enzyme